MENTNFYFENKQDNHTKFWAISIVKEKNSHFTLIRRWGKIGENGRTMQERFFNSSKAETRRDKLIAEKTNKGYTAVL